ncbi:MAG TPA: ectonucleotide pyrophosphatase/phosphodiesterase [Terracidiphilus sp.]
MRFAVRHRPALGILLLTLGVGTSLLRAQPDGSGRSPEQHADTGRNSARMQSEPYVVLLALDGFRASHLERGDAAHLTALGKQGAWAPQGMFPSYPALGIANRYTIVTGLYPGHHGLVADNFYDPERKARFSDEEPKDLAANSWYRGTPLWSLAESQGMRTAVFGWPGAEAEIAGFRPTYLIRAGAGDEAKQILEQTLKWLRLPAEKRPHFLAIDFPEPASAARRFGPEAKETKAAEQRADDLAGRLKAELDKTSLPVDLIVVSDRGLARTEGAWITLEQFTSLSGFVTDGPLLYGTDEQQRERVYRQLNHVSSLFFVYRRKDMPPEMHMNTNSRAGDPVVMATGPYAIRARGPAPGQHDAPPPAGVDGLDPQEPEMRAIFLATGPDVVSGKSLGPFENVNLYPWIAHMLGLKPPKSDGSLNVLAGTLRDDGTERAGEPAN